MGGTSGPRPKSSTVDPSARAPQVKLGSFNGPAADRTDEHRRKPSPARHAVSVPAAHLRRTNNQAKSIGVNVEINRLPPGDSFQRGAWWASKSSRCRRRRKVFGHFWPLTAVEPRHICYSRSSDQTRGLFCGVAKICQACGAQTNFIFCFLRETPRQVAKDFFVAAKYERSVTKSLDKQLAKRTVRDLQRRTRRFCPLRTNGQMGARTARVVPRVIELFPIVVGHRVVVPIEQHAMIRVEIAGRAIV